MAQLLKGTLLSYHAATVADFADFASTGAVGTSAASWRATLMQEIAALQALPGIEIPAALLSNWGTPSAQAGATADTQLVFVGEATAVLDEIGLASDTTIASVAAGMDSATIEIQMNSLEALADDIAALEPGENAQAVAIQDALDVYLTTMLNELNTYVSTGAADFTESQAQREALYAQLAALSE